MRVVYETITDCEECYYNLNGKCNKLNMLIKDVSYDKDCPLPFLETVERFTRYITPDKRLSCHGNCRNWERWLYNKHLMTDLGICKKSVFNKIVYCNSPSCDEFEEI